MARRRSLFWRVFAVNAGLLGAVALLLLFSPVEIDAPIKRTQALIVAGGLVITVIANALLLRPVVAPLERLARRMETVDLLRPGQRLPVSRSDEIGRVVAAFNRMLDRLERERQESGRRVLAAQEAERVGIARDLHDEVGQVLTGVLLQLNSIAETRARASRGARRSAAGRAPRARRGAADLERAAAGDARASRPGQRADRALERRSRASPASASSASSTTSLPKLAPEVELAVYRIAQESLTNVARHAQASRVTIALEPGHDSVVLRLADDGRGFAGAPDEHGGLRSMRERALLVGGALAIKEAPEGGVEVRLEVPTAEVAPALEVS